MTLRKENIQRKEHISEDFFKGKVADIAEDLLGKLLVNEELSISGIIVETEAYLGVEDPASHLRERFTCSKSTITINSTS